MVLDMFFLHRKETRLATRAFTERRVQIRAPDERMPPSPFGSRHCSSSTFRMAKQKGPLFYTAATPGLSGRRTTTTPAMAHPIREGE